MAHVLVHTDALDDLARRPAMLPPELAAALSAHLVYGRFGAVLPDLPYFGDPATQLARRALGRPPERPPFGTLLHNGAPVALGLRLCELVGRASFVGRMPGVAVVAGYFAHVAVDRTLQPPVHELARRLAEPGEHPRATERRISYLQAILHLKRREGRPVLGWRGTAERLRILKRPGFPYRGIGRGLHLLVQKACQDTLGPAPRKSELDGWVRGLYLYGAWLSSPAARHLGMPEDADELARQVFRGPDFDFESLYLAAVQRARHHVVRAFEYLSEGDFSRSARDQVLQDLPEGSIS